MIAGAACEPAPARPAAAPKRFLQGTHRAVPPDVTLARLAPLLGRLGITRVGMLTGLDRVGLPVAQAIRPNSRAVAVSLGKGATVEAAKVSAIMESVESFHAESVTGPLHWAAAREIEGAVDPARLPAAPGAGGAPPEAARCLWIAGRDLATGQARWVPFQLVHTDYTVGAAEAPRFQATSNGLAAGNLVVEAQLHALYEVIERDALACWRAAGGPGARVARPVAVASLDGALGGMAERIAAAEADLAVWDVTSDVGVPAFVALVVPRAAAPSGVEAEIGSGCHLDPEVALARAITEAAQTRLARIAGARDDFERTSYDAEARRRRRVEARDWLTLARRGPRPWAEVREGFAWAPSDDLAADLAAVLGALAAAGLCEAVWVDLARPDIGLPVGRVIVPGLEGPYLPGRYVPGARARAAAR